MSNFETLPIILVSAENEIVANEIITELIDNDVTDEYAKLQASPDRVWRLVNKYYKADVRVCGVGDRTPTAARPDPTLVDAHVVYIDESEMEGPEEGAETARARGELAGWARAHVRVLACHGARAPPRLRAHAAAARADLAPRSEPPAPARDLAAPFAEARGWARARAALHAHAWRGLARLDGPPGGWAPASASSSDAGEDSVDSVDSMDEEELAVERAEAFAQALGALGAAPPAARRANAEALLGAFCRALGMPPL